MFDDLLNRLEYCTTEKTKNAYSSDASIFRVVPEGVLYPKSSMDVMQLVRLNAKQIKPHSLTVRAAGTCMSGGALNEGIIIDVTKYLNNISNVDVQHKTITVESGMMFREIEKATALQGLMFPPYTSSKNICSIGGMLGNNSSGELSVRYGATIDWVESIDVVLSDGNLHTFGELTAEAFVQKQTLGGFEGTVYKVIAQLLEEKKEVIKTHTPLVPKNAAGYQLAKIYNEKKGTYNLARLFIGAQGTLGVITAATLRLVPVPQHRKIVAVAIHSIQKIGEVLHALRALHPESIETFDVYTYELAKTYHHEDALRIAYVCEGAPLTLFIQVSEDTDEATYQKQQEVILTLHSFHLQVYVVSDPMVRESFFIVRRASFKMLMDQSVGSLRVAPCIEDTIVPIEKYSIFLGSLENILKEYPYTYTYAGHIGDGSIRLVPLVDFSLPNAAEKIFELSERVYNLVLSLGGSISVDHNDGLMRTYYLEKQYGHEMMECFKTVKNLFDPHVMYNPGKKIPTSTIGSKKYAIQNVTS